MRTSRFVCAIGLLISLSCGARAADGDWPCWLGANHDAKSADKGLLKEWPAGGPKLLWKVDNIGRGFSGVAVADNTVYITGDVDGTLNIFAFDMTGKPLWKAENGSGYNVEGNYPGSRATPTIDGESLYLYSGVGRLGCFDAKTGQPKWKREAGEFGGRQPNWGFAESVLIYKDWAVFTPGGANCIVALEKNTGKTVWQSKGFNGAAQYGSILPVEFEGVPLFIAGTHGGIVIVDARDGKVLFSNRFAAGNVASCPTPAYADGHVFWSVGYGKGNICLKLKKAGGSVSAAVAWSNREMSCHHGGYIIDNGYVYGNHNDGWSCLDLKSGERQWFDRAGSIGKGSVTYADGMLYLFSENNGNLALASFTPQGLQIKGKLKVDGTGPSWAHPVITGGRLYVRYDRNLYCFDVKGN